MRNTTSLSRRLFLSLSCGTLLAQQQGVQTIPAAPPNEQPTPDSDLLRFSTTTQEVIVTIAACLEDVP